MNAFFGDNTMFTTGCGLNQIWSGQFQEINKPRMYLPSGGGGTLGFDIPAAIGAKIAKPEYNAVAVMGDFGFTFLDSRNWRLRQNTGYRSSSSS